jgi:hypothetical protein
MTIFDLWIRRINYVPQRLRDIEKKAVEMEVRINQAIGARRSYLKKELALYKEASVDHLTRAIICWPMERILEKQIKQLQDELYYQSHPIEGRGLLPDALIEKAKQFPIHELIEFDQQGQALCFNHKEKTPSLHLNIRNNICHCFGACQKNFDSVDVLMLRDGKNFRDAVQQLARGS